MNVLFMSLLSFNSLNESNIYTDLLREFVKNKHHVYAISPIERRYKKNTQLIKENENVTILRIKIGNIQKTGAIEKGFSTLLIENLFIKEIKRHFSNIRFDLVLYSTPPITFVGAVEYVKKRDGAKTYLLLKDIFPQNAIDIGMLNKTGLKGIVYKYFKHQEERLYTVSDRIGCMSQANVDYIIQHNKWIEKSRVEICPNSIETIDKSVSISERNLIRNKYGIPKEKKVFIYGGNLGKPQGIPFLIKCIDACKKYESIYFLIVGNGTEYGALEKYVASSNQQNIKLMKTLPKDDFDMLVGACDVGMVFLDRRFTIPNFPSRILSYMQAHLAVLAATDPNTDVGKIIENGKFGWWCESDDLEKFCNIVRYILDNDICSYGENSFKYLKEHYDVSVSYSIIERLGVCNENPNDKCRLWN